MKHDLADLVGNADIAERCGVGRPAVSNWIKRYSDFPTPLLTISSGTRIWSWVEVQEWLTHRNLNNPNGKENR